MKRWLYTIVPRLGRFWVSCAVVLFVCSLVPAMARDKAEESKCRSLIELNEQWKGVVLTPEQAGIKAQLEAWYRVNCKARRGGRGRLHRTADRGQYGHVSPEIRQWFNGLTNQKNFACCSMADGFSVDDPEWGRVGDNYRVRLNGQWFDVPEQALVQGNNRIGRAIVWPVTSEGVTVIRCFMPGAET